MFLLCYLSPTIMHVRIRDTSDYALNVFILFMMHENYSTSEGS